MVSTPKPLKQSRFNVVMPSGEDQAIVWNTFTDSRLLVDAAVLEAIERCDDPSGLSAMQCEYLETLTELGILLDNSIDEDRQVEYWFQRLRHDTKILNITLLTTMACNMGCVYCFEQGAPSSGSMDEATALVVCKWLLQRVEVVRPSTLKITYFGGEPLVNLKVVVGNCNIFQKQNWFYLSMRGACHGALINPLTIVLLHSSTSVTQAERSRFPFFDRMAANQCIQIHCGSIFRHLFSGQRTSQELSLCLMSSNWRDVLTILTLLSVHFALIASAL